ncbi:MAG: hypothetical protein ABH860_00625 [bacterium]
MKNSKAFILIEVLIASLLICLFASSFTFLVNAGIKQIKASRQLTRAVFVSKSIMEELRGIPFEALYPYNNTSFDGGQGRIIIASVGSDLISITVKHKIEFYTLRSRF